VSVVLWLLWVELILTYLLCPELVGSTSMKRLSRVEAADDPADGASEDDGAVQKEPEIISSVKRLK
jgi:hypothetical protein